jgi:hypothetical protein
MKFIPTSLSRVVGRQLLVVQKHSPHILFTAGVVGVVTSAVLASRATLKLAPVLEEAEYEINSVKTELKHRKGQYQKDLTYVYTKNSLEVIRLYAPAVIIGTVSIGLLTGSHIQLTRRNTALTAAYAAVSTAYESYRERVREEIGTDRETELYHSISLKKVMVESKTAEIMAADPNTWSPYARFFDEASINWQKNAELNRNFIQCQQNWLNQKLHAVGHVFLNEAYDALGLERSGAGAVVGWLLDANGDNYIDFGLYEASSARFINGLERNVILDFNVDGVIFDKI